jgi:hypothetical protein
MATPEEIERRIEQTDAPRTTRRSAAAKRVSELAQHRAAIAEQLTDIERQLGDVLADARDVIDMEELAQFTDVPVADLTRWLEVRTLTRTRRKKSTGTSGTKSNTSRGTTAAPVRTPTARQASTPSGPATATVPARVVAK